MRDLIGTLAGSGLGALELFSMGLKATGMYMSRTLSYQVHQDGNKTYLTYPRSRSLTPHYVVVGL